jgi:hypothetical protein
MWRENLFMRIKPPKSPEGDFASPLGRLGGVRMTNRNQAKRARRIKTARRIK